MKPAVAARPAHSDHQVGRPIELIRQARLPQGDGLSQPCDLLIAGDRISAIGRSIGADVAGHRVVEADGRVVLPGLVDAHCHGAAAVFDPAVQLAMLRQGITTIVAGQDGIGAAPSDATSHAWSATYFAGIDGDSARLGPGALGQWLACYDGEVPVNLALTVPHGSLRYLVAGPAQRSSSPAEVEQMCQLLEAGLLDGAVGLSTGLEYVPAAWADRNEMVALLTVVARHHRVHSSHMRGYEAASRTAVAELVDWAQASGAATHIAHFHGDATVLGGLLDQARADGVALTFDSYDYQRGCSLLAMIALPTWLPLADAAETVAWLTDRPDVTQRLADHLAGLGDLPTRTRLAWADGSDPTSGRPLDWVAGLSLAEVAGRWGVGSAEAVIRLLVGTRLRATCVFAQPPTNTAASVLALADRPEHMAGSDAIYVPFGQTGPTGSGRPHPRGWGGVVRWLAEKVVRRQDWTWAEAVDHLSTRAVARFGLGDRGRLGAGAVADLILVDPATLADRATYEQPRRAASGIDDVIVAGVPVLAGGQLTGQTPGMGLRWRGGGRD